jgi:hypothetical protein
VGKPGARISKRSGLRAIDYRVTDLLLAPARLANCPVLAERTQMEPGAELVGFGIPITAANDLLARRALEAAAGVEFIEENGGGRACD